MLRVDEGEPHATGRGGCHEPRAPMAIFNPVSKVHVKFGDIFGENSSAGTESNIQELVD
jgi:hypothetical protein